MKRECETCIKRKTMYCPNSSECFDTENKPYYQNRIMLLEENQELKKQLEESKENYNCLLKQKEQFEYIMSKQVDCQGQQKEFIEWLENEMSHVKERIDYIENCAVLNHTPELYLNKGYLCALERVLQNYKEIIGVENDKVD